jgi:hypothetical protein
VNIPLGIIATLLVFMGALLFTAGLALGLYRGEKGRRRDVQYWADLDPAPPEQKVDAEVQRAPDPDETAMERAEIETVFEGLKSDMEASGRHVNDEEVRLEALRLVTQAHSELGE